MISINQLTKVYGSQTALNIPELTIGRGEIVGLVGNNGAGKTTLLRILLDILQPTTGHAAIDGQRVDQSTEWKEFTGSFIDDRFLIDFYTPEEYFDLIAQLYHLQPGELSARLADFDQLMHGEILATGKYLRNFSQGNRQKTGIIGAMMIHPQLLILDEPFNYLDPSSQMIVARRICRLNAELGTTVLLSSHNLEFVSEISTRILLLERGEIAKDLRNANGEAIAELKEYFALEE